MLPLPDRDSAPYWEGLAQGAVKLQHCRACKSWNWPARPICSKCQSDDFDWETVSGAGSIASWVVAHRAYSPDMAPYVPYVIALVRLDEQDDLLVPGRLLGTAQLYAGMRVKAKIETLAEHIGALNWEAQD